MPSSTVGQEEYKQQQQWQPVIVSADLLPRPAGIVYSRVWRQLWHCDNDMQPMKSGNPKKDLKGPKGDAWQLQVKACLKVEP